jgi:transposase-like protein
MPPIVRSLPPLGTRWVVRRKAALIEAVRSGEITLDEACRQYQLSPEEFNGWVSAYEKHGAPGLRVTRYQIYRAFAYVGSQSTHTKWKRQSTFGR